MKKLKFLVAAAATGMVLLTSCLGETSNTSSGSTYGIIDYSSTYMKMVYPADNLPWYSPVIDKSDLERGDCVFFAYTINGDDPVNNAGNPYVTIEVPEKGYRVVSQTSVTPYLSEEDTSSTAMKKNELTFSNVAAANSISVIKDRLIMIFAHPESKQDQKNRYEMFFKSGDVKEVDGKRVYDLYIRGIKEADGKEATGLSSFEQMFDTESFFSNTKQMEKNAGNKLVNFRLNYYKEFNKDTTIGVWDKSPVLSIEIPADEK